MADCAPCRLYVGDQIAEVVSVMVEEMARRGVQVAGGVEGGTFSIAIPTIGSIRGKFQLSGKSLAVEIQSRPADVGCGAIESKIQDFILDAKAVVKNRQRK
jgi:hypothetical protein